MRFKFVNETRIIDPNGHKAGGLYRARIITRPIWSVLTGEKMRTANPVCADLHLLQMALAEDGLEYTVRQLLRRRARQPLLHHKHQAKEQEEKKVPHLL
jgi:hypothetical protein